MVTGTSAKPSLQAIWPTTDLRSASVPMVHGQRVNNDFHPIVSLSHFFLRRGFEESLSQVIGKSKYPVVDKTEVNCGHANTI